MFFFSTIPHPPTSTPFPCTALSGSLLVAQGYSGPPLGGGLPGHGLRHYVDRLRARDPSGKRAAGTADRPLGRTRLQRGDRKSTRLNSSHANISYAVFCLKKKKFKKR